MSVNSGSTQGNRWEKPVKKCWLSSLRLINAIRRKVWGKNKDDLPVLKKRDEKKAKNRADIQVKWENIGSKKNGGEKAEDDPPADKTTREENPRASEGDFRIIEGKKEPILITYLFELHPSAHYRWALAKEYPAIKLKKAFEDHRYCLPPDLNIEEKKNDLWIIQNGDYTFLVKDGKTNSASKGLKVYLKWDYIFTVESEVPLSEREQIRGFLKEIFKEYGISLAENFKVSVKNKKLIVKDSDFKFGIYLKRSGKKLRIYNKKSVASEGSISSLEEVPERDSSGSDSVDYGSDIVEEQISEREQEISVDWKDQKSDAKRKSSISGKGKKKEKSLIKIPDKVLKRCVQEIDVEEQILLFAKKEKSGDWIVWRTEKPRLKEHSQVFSRCDSKSLNESLKSSEKYHDSFCGLIHRHPSGGKQTPSSTDIETTDSLDLLYSQIFSGIVGSENRVLTVFFESEDAKLKVVGNNVKKRGENNDGRKFWKLG